jgi:predicted small lipoprotein YifL
MRTIGGVMALLVVSASLAGCGLTRYLSVPDTEHLDLLEQQRQQEEVRSMEQQAMQAHEQAMRMHREMASPPPPIP